MVAMRLLLLICLAVSACNSGNGLRILGLFPLNGKSHWQVVERMLLTLAKKGHRVDVVTQFPVKNPPKNYNEISLEGSVELLVNNLNASIITRMSMRDMSHLVQMNGNRTCELLGHPKLRELIDSSPNPPYDVILVELFVFPCYLAFGRHFNAPMVGVMSSSFFDWMGETTGNPVNPSYMANLFSPYDSKMTFWERLMNTCLTNVVTTQINYYMSQQIDYVKRYFNLDVTIHELHKDLAAILVNSHHSINGVRPMSTGIIEIGGVHIEESSEPLPAELQKWLDESTHGCIYFTFGSMVRIETFPKPIVETFYKVFEKIAPVRVMMKIAKAEDLLPGLPKNVLIRPWFPQPVVFKHKNVKAFITHGGLLSSQEAVYYEIPLIGIPLFGDQHKNLRNVANKKIGVNLVSLNNITEESLTAAINTVLYNETIRTSIKKVSKLFKDRPMGALDTAIYYVEYIARNGYAIRSPAVDLTWWQQNLLDVYGFLIACLVTAISVLVFVIKKLKNLLFGCKNVSKKESKSSESKKKK